MGNGNIGAHIETIPARKIQSIVNIDRQESEENTIYNDESSEDIYVNEALTGHKPVPLGISNKVKESVCKIIIKKKRAIIYGTGFFLKISESLKFLFANYHTINKDLINDNIEIEIWNKEKMSLNLKKRYIKFYPEKSKDVTIIEIKEEDKIYEKIKFLDYDLNYKERGYSSYQDAYVFTLQYPSGDDISSGSGKILSINNYEFTHDISTEKGSSGCPIILLNNNINLILVIGIHKCANISKSINCGTFIGEIINEFKNNSKITKKESNDIIAKINIKDKEVNKFIRIINSYENYMEYNGKTSLQKCKNEKKIKECEIRINNELIRFSYFHVFEKEGNYTIKYTFKNLLTKTNYLFSECSSLISIDLSNFNTNNVTNMSSMFYRCSSLKNIVLSNFKTQNVTDMCSMFDGCSSLKNIDLFNFNTQNVTDMCSMFDGCSSLFSLDLSNFNTQKVKKMCKMLNGCSSLKKIYLSNFKTKNCTDMCSLFNGCSSLISIDLSNFNTQNVKNMCKMFYGCSSLKNIDLLNFNTQNVTNMSYMFSKCSSLSSLDLSNFKILNSLNMCKMLSGCSSLVCVNLYNFNPEKFAKNNCDIKKELFGLFEGCSAL